MARTIFLIFTVISTAASAATKVSDCMSEQERIRTGTSKLSAVELNKLSDWLAERGFECSCEINQSCETETNSADFAVKQKNDERELHATIPGHFAGWTGETLFTLSDGSQWQQRVKGVKLLNLVDPEVTIYKNWLGFYEMQIDATGDVVKVSKVR